MSSEATAWAKEQRCGDPVTKAILGEIANWTKPTGVCEFLSIRRLAEVVEVSERTVQRHIRRLESEDRAAGGLALIRRIVRHREDGGQGANSFELVGFTPPEGARAGGRKAPRQSVTPPCQIDTAPRQCDGEPGDNGVTRLGDKTIPPSPSDDGDTPAADFDDDSQGEAAADPPIPPAKALPHRLPDDWAPPPVAELPPSAGALVRQWPSGAYEAVSETFRLHWIAETRAIGRKSNWLAALGKWLISDHPKVMRDARAGVSFAALAPVAAQTGAAHAARPATPAKARENDASGKVHAALRRSEGDAMWRQWLEPCALLMANNEDQHGNPMITLTVIAGSDFQAAHVESRFLPAIERAVKGVAGGLLPCVRFAVERAAAQSAPARLRAHDGYPSTEAAA